MERAPTTTTTTTTTFGEGNDSFFFASRERRRAGKKRTWIPASAIVALMTCASSLLRGSSRFSGFAFTIASGGPDPPGRGRARTNGPPVLAV